MKTKGLLLFLFISQFAFGQKDRYRFAESYFGLETEYVQENSTFVNPNNGNTEKLPTTISPRLLIGGTHFWGHADFYVSIPLSSIRLDGSDDISISNSGFVGFRVLPFKLCDNSIRPFAGFVLNSKDFQFSKGPLYSNLQWHAEGGLQYRKSNRIISFSVRHFFKNSYEAALTRSDFQSIETAPFSYSLSYSFVIDGTANYSRESAKRYVQKIRTRAKEKNAFSAFSFGLGLNGLIPLGETELARDKPFFNDEIEGNLGPDIGIGYYSAKMDASTRISFRPLKQEEEAYGYSHQVRRYSTALEWFKFIGDYHGFAPFIGPYISHDYYQITEKDQGVKVLADQQHRLGYGLVFGWDIRQTDIDYLILRTNLRYSPAYDYKSGGLRFTAKQLEFNFIQIVFYPERYKLHKQ